MAKGTSLKDLVERKPPSGISTLIVGAGPGGLTAAIEFYRKGHAVRIVEKEAGLSPFGEGFVIGPSALRTMRNWPEFVDRLEEFTYPSTMRISKDDGTFLGEFPLGSQDEHGIPCTRKGLHYVLHQYITELGMAVEFNSPVKSYFEDDSFGGVVLENGAEIKADLVIAADGVGSKSWEIVTGTKDKATSSSFAIYRSSYPLHYALADPVLAEEFNKVGRMLHAFIGNNSHCIISKSETEVSYLFTYKDTGNAEEGWSKTQSVEKAIKAASGWKFVENVVRATPHDVIDWKLMWRNPQPVWASPKARVLQVGDSAHSFLPTSVSGATMAFEDAISIAACLDAAGKDNMTTAVRTHNKLRFERVSCAQKMGFKTRERWHHTNWELVAKDPSIIGKVLDKWVINHDAEKYAYENYDSCAKSITHGLPFVNTNFVPNYTYVPWTIKELLAASEGGGSIVDEGDWE